eukprot:GFKZ01003072.1.p1 GENE.GFKZ01003072.1~~GFKZ01003072.1.p1  ORF type:complete len:176 (+),score=13.16 GFKZ01003072.1:495-1022(+)
MAVPPLLLVVLYGTMSYGHLLPPSKTLPYHPADRQIISAASLISDLEEVANSTVQQRLPASTDSVIDLGLDSNGGPLVISNLGPTNPDSGTFFFRLPPRLTADALRAARAADSLRECLVDLDALTDRDGRQGRTLSGQLRRVLRSTSRLIEVTLELFDKLSTQKRQRQFGFRGNI